MVSYLIIFLLGVIIGILVQGIKCTGLEKIQDIRSIPQGETQFIESVSDKEKFNKAEHITDLLSDTFN